MKAKKALIFSLLFVSIIALISLPLAFASDTNTTPVTSESTNISDEANTGNILTDNGNTTPPEIPNGTGNGTPPDMPNGNSPNGTGPSPIENITGPTTTLTGNNITVTYGAGENYTVTLTTINGTPISGQHIALNLTRLSDGASKVYWATTDTKGIAELEINLYSGYYTSSSSYEGNDTLNYTSSSCFNTIIVVTNSTTNKSSTVLIVQPFTEVYGAGENFTATLKNANGTAIIGNHIALNLTRLSDGASKVYWATTDTNGIADLQINLYPGSYTVSASFSGEDNYTNSSAATTITVTSNGTSNNTTSKGKLVVNGETVTASNGAYSTSSSDTNVILVKNGGNLNLTDSTITKTGDVSSSNSENSDFYGTNAAVLVLAKSTLNISDCSIITNATGANAIFVTNSASSNFGAIAYVNNVNISTYKDKSRGLDATYGGTIIADNVIINTRGGSCAALATDRGEGTVNATNCVLNTGVGQTSGSGSPCIYSTGSISATNCTGTSYVAEIGCIEGKNSIILNNCNLTGYAKGNRANSSGYVDSCGFFIYQSISGDAAVGTSTLNAY